MVELAEQGTDTVKTTLLEYRLSDNVENLYFTGSGNFTGYGIWIACYRNTSGVALPDGRDWAFWQFSDEARCNGISEPIDLNVFSGTATALDGICKK